MHSHTRSAFFRADVMVLNDIIEQAAGRQSRASDHGGKYTHKQTQSRFPISLLQKVFGSSIQTNRGNNVKTNAKHSQTEICVLPFTPPPSAILSTIVLYLYYQRPSCKILDV